MLSDGIGIRIGNEKDRKLYNMCDSKINRIGIIDGTYLMRTKQPSITKQFKFLIDPETSIFNYPKKIIADDEKLFQYMKLLIEGELNKSQILDSGDTYLHPEFLRNRLEPLTESIFRIESGNLSFSEKSLIETVKDNPQFASYYSAPYFSLMIDNFPDEMIELNIESYSLMRDLIKDNSSYPNNIVSMIDLDLNDLLNYKETVRSISRILIKNPTKTVGLKLIRRYDTLKSSQIENLYKILKWLKTNEYQILSQNLGLEGVVLSWLLDIPTIFRGIFSERIHPKKRLRSTSSDKSATTKQTGGPSLRLYDSDLMLFHKNVSCNCNECKIIKKGEKGTILKAHSSHNLNSLLNEFNEINNIPSSNRKTVVQNKIKNAILNSQRKKEFTGIINHIKKLQKIDDFISEV
ncbi:MAG: hypothetical protein ACTSSK_03305 [Candidatus Heimdallarchaeota archaeon]